MPIFSLGVNRKLATKHTGNRNQSGSKQAERTRLRSREGGTTHTDMSDARGDLPWHGIDRLGREAGNEMAVIESARDVAAQGIGQALADLRHQSPRHWTDESAAEDHALMRNLGTFSNHYKA